MVEREEERRFGVISQTLLNILRGEIGRSLSSQGSGENVLSQEKKWCKIWAALPGISTSWI